MKNDSDLDELRSYLRSAEPPAGAKGRVLGKALRELEGDATKRRGLWPLGLAAVLACGVAGAAAAGSLTSWLSRGNVVAPPTSEVPNVDAARPELTAEEPVGTSPRETHPTEEASLPRVGEVSSAPTEKVPVAPRPAALPPHKSDLAQQVEAYEHAVSLNDAQAISALRGFKRRWPASPLTHEVDLKIVALLGRSTDVEATRRAATDFVVQHPDSARAKDVEALLKEKPSP